MNTVSENQILNNSNFSYFSWHDRPEQIKDQIKICFNTISSKIAPTWTHNGAVNYELCQVNDHKLLKKLIDDSSQQTTFNLLDIGAGDFSWINSAAQLFYDNNKYSDKKFNIFGLNGEGDSRVVEYGNVSLYYYGGFQIENLVEEMSQRGHDLQNNIDLIVSSWTLRHTIDPIGTLQQAYSLLKPVIGLMFIDDTFLYYKQQDGTDLLRGFGLDQLRMLKSFDAKILMCPSSNMEETSHSSVAIQKTSDKVEIPAIYYGLKKDEVHACKYMTEVQSFFLTKYIYPNDCNHFLGSPYLGSKELYYYFKSNELFEYYDNEYSLRHPFCGECIEIPDLQ